MMIGMFAKARPHTLPVLEDAKTIAPLSPRQTAELLPLIWADAKAIGRMTGIGRSTLYALADRGLVKSSSLKERDKLRGKKLFSVPSVLAFIEARATGGEDREEEPAGLATA